VIGHLQGFSVLSFACLYVFFLCSSNRFAFWSEMIVGFGFKVGVRAFSSPSTLKWNGVNPFAVVRIHFPLWIPSAFFNFESVSFSSV
jgi:hypothetical protein